MAFETSATIDLGTGTSAESRVTDVLSRARWPDKLSGMIYVDIGTSAKSSGADLLARVRSSAIASRLLQVVELQGSASVEAFPGKTTSSIRHTSGSQVAKFSVRQFFEGVVLRADATSPFFTAALTDRTNPAMPDESVEIDRSEVDEQDWELIAQGACFYWYIGYETTSAGRRRVGEIRFRRLPRLTESELSEGRRRAASSRIQFD